VNLQAKPLAILFVVAVVVSTALAQKTLTAKDASQHVGERATVCGVAFSLLKSELGTWHRVSAKHLAACHDEMTCRFNNRKNPVPVPRYDA
jgi:high-affinity nickel permease